MALFYYSEHGHIDSVGGYLVTPDFTECDYGVSLQEILSIANNSKCKETIIYLIVVIRALWEVLIPLDTIQLILTKELPS